MGRNRISRLGSHQLTRRRVLELGLGAGAALVGSALLPRGAWASGLPSTPIRFQPFTRELPTIANGQLTVLKSQPAFATGCTFPVTAKPNFYAITMKRAQAEIIPGVKTEIWGYDGLYPGPVIVSRMGTPDVIRFANDLDVETSIHQHGGHNPSDSDGLPMRDQLIFPGQSKDYCYPNQPSTGPDGRPDPNDNPSFLWYHDHATDITGPNVYRGLAGVYPVLDDLESGLIAAGKLPEVGSAFDLPLVLQDRLFNADGSLFYSPFEHDGFLGDVFVVNGKAQPFHVVQRRKYRLRILNGSNARIYMLRLSSGARFLQIGADRWLFPHPVERDRILLGMAEVADVIVDFGAQRPGDVVYLENILVQDSGRGPGGDLNAPDVRVPGTPLVKFVVAGGQPAGDLSISRTEPLRPITPISPGEIVATRTFEFNRSQGAWQVNGQFYDEDRADAQVKLGTAERWILKNGGGGWWHPIHIHLENHLVQRFNGRPPPVYNSFKKDTTLLGPGDEAEVFIRFRDHAGRFVAHCHNVEHEDDRMMIRWDTVAP
ncbi:MAG TPA: multicopper oxidase domain-containing protein [Anaeromyxobacteraceae bacterium]